VSSLLGEQSASYSAAGDSWAAGPIRVYGRLAEELVGRCPGGVAGRRAVDIGAGTGAASRALLAAGATEVVAVDAARGMLDHDRAARPPAVVGDACSLPFGPGSFGAAVAAFSFNHLAEPARGLADAARVLVPGGGLAVSAYADDDTHPVKEVVDRLCRERGWVEPAWATALRKEAAPALATVERGIEAADAAGLAGAVVERVRVPFPELGPADLVAWRLGLAQVAEFINDLTPTERDDLAAEARARLGACPELVRIMVVITWMRPGH
jgi:SAM-dependent methyltransferase